MNNQNRQGPKPDDAVLGGQNLAPMDGAVLGGIQGVRQKLASADEAERKEGVLQVPNYGEPGIAALLALLEAEKNQELWWQAYHTLEKQGDLGINRKLKNVFPCYEYESVTVNRRGEIIKRTPGKAKYYREDLGNGAYLDMVYIAGGSFLMGSPESEYQSYDDERPQHRVTAPDFWLGKYQVTQAQWQAIMENNPSCFQGENRPVEQVNWDDCQDFCRKLSTKTGKLYRLPSEEEWEYACRAGTTTPFNCGETITTELANYHGTSTYAEEGEGIYRMGTVEVGSFLPNPWGLYEMHGNVCEWCADDWYDSYAQKLQTLKSDESITQSSSNVFGKLLRGGCWLNALWDCRSAYRSDPVPGLRYSLFGFRVLCESPRLS